MSNATRPQNLNESFHGEKQIFKHLIVGLIYPAVLGALIYFFIEFWGGFIESGHLPLMFNAPVDEIILKACLLIMILLFYCCDFLYTTYSKKFRFLYFWFDLAIMVGLIATFKAAKYDSSELPEMATILKLFLGFIILYLFWDGFELMQSENDEIASEKRLYKQMVGWEVGCIVVFLSIFLLQYLQIINEYSMRVCSIIGISIATIIFIFLVWKKWKLYFLPVLKSE
ncbi:MAG: hypothetical protein IPI64_02385 [Chloracidobacterium sp.]|nr:hypothetical protein [Chloracidobacterium sp.]